jgi:hypothetical protein
MESGSNHLLEAEFNEFSFSMEFIIYKAPVIASAIFSKFINMFSMDSYSCPSAAPVLYTWPIDVNYMLYKMLGYGSFHV